MFNNLNCSRCILFPRDMLVSVSLFSSLILKAGANHNLGCVIHVTSAFCRYVDISLDDC